MEFYDTLHLLQGQEGVCGKGEFGNNSLTLFLFGIAKIKSKIKIKQHKESSEVTGQSSWYSWF